MLKTEIHQPLRRQCDIRLGNDTLALEAAASGTDRLSVQAERFGDRVRKIHAHFPQVRTAFKDVETREVEIVEARVGAIIIPNDGNGFPYPLSPPQVRMDFPGLPRNKTPFLSGLSWWDGENPDESELLGRGAIPALIMGLAGALTNGVPCLWRDGEWNRECDLVFVAKQIHLLLTDPGAWSPEDSWNKAAALHWAANKEKLPFEPPIQEIYSMEASAVSHGRIEDTTLFSLTEVG